MSPDDGKSMKICRHMGRFDFDGARPGLVMCDTCAAVMTMALQSLLDIARDAQDDIHPALLTCFFDLTGEHHKKSVKDRREYNTNFQRIRRRRMKALQEHVNEP